MIKLVGESEFSRHIRGLASRYHLGTTCPSNQDELSSIDIHTLKEIDGLVSDKTLISVCSEACTACILSSSCLQLDASRPKGQINRSQQRRLVDSPSPLWSGCDLGITRSKQRPPPFSEV